MRKVSISYSTHSNQIINQTGETDFNDEFYAKNPLSIHNKQQKNDIIEEDKEINSDQSSYIS